MGEVADQSRTASRATVVKLAQRYLDGHQPRDYKLVARADKVQKENDTWYVQVDPIPEDVSSGDFINRVIDAQMDLQESEGLEVELTNMLPRDVAVAETLLPRFASALLVGQKRGKRNGHASRPRR